MSSKWRRFEVLLPVQFNDGRAVPEEWLGEALFELADHFGGASFETQKVEGVWRHSGIVYRDNLVRLVVDIPDLSKNRKWMKGFKSRWKARLEQLELWMELSGRDRIKGHARQRMSTPLATHDYVPGGLQTTLEFLKRMRSELRTLFKVRVWKDHIHIIDVNKDFFEVRGIGYPDADVVPLLQNINTAFNPETIHSEFDGEYKEFGAGNRYPWAYDRVM